VKKDTVQTNVTLPAPAPAASAIKPPNYMVFVCSLDRADKAARAAKDPARLERFQALRAEAIAAYKAKDYGRAAELHNEAHAVAKGDTAAAEVVAVAAAGSPRPPKAAKGKKAPATKAPAKAAAPKPAPAKPAAKQPAKASKPATAKPAKGERLSAMDAAHRVLATSKEALNVKQLIAEMSSQGLWTSPGGKTPHSTLAAALGRDIAAKGRESRFKKADRGMFAASGRGV
jgi:hypothetical protein